MSTRDRGTWWTAVQTLEGGDPVTAHGLFVRSGPHPSAEAGRAAVSAMFGSDDRAERLLRPVLDAHPQEPCLLQLGALTALQAGDMDTAQARAQQAVDAAPELFNAALIRTAVRAQAHPEQAREAAEELVAAYPDRPSGYLLLTAQALGKGDHTAAIPSLEKLQSLDFPVTDTLLTAYRATGRLGDALQLYAELGNKLGDDGAIAASEDPAATFYEVLGMTAEQDLVATIRTSEGDLRCTLFPAAAPLTVANFVGLARGRITWTHPDTEAQHTEPLYNGTVLHRVIPEFMIQGGDPRGDGSGGPGYRFVDEIDPRLRFTQPGALAMANSGPATNGSQFFVTEKPTGHLDGKHTIFGQCDEASVEKVRAITSLPRDSSNRPKSPVTITTIEIEAVDR
jgi:peptidyl-prolyl cis-trans isomerase A (cyclophilin A)